MGDVGEIFGEGDGDGDLEMGWFCEGCFFFLCVCFFFCGKKTPFADSFFCLGFAPGKR